MIVELIRGSVFAEVSRCADNIAHQFVMPTKENDKYIQLMGERERKVERVVMKGRSSSVKEIHIPWPWSFAIN
jgi:hypothetical protein